MVLVAINRLQLRQFFPRGLPLTMGDATLIARPTDVMTPTDWLGLLDEVRPTVLISGWSTPELPHRFTKPAGGSVAYLCHLTGSVRGVISAESIAAGFLVTNWGGVAAPMVAEHALLLALAALRNLPAWPAFMRRTFVHDDKEVLGTRTLHQGRVAIHGFGAVARALLNLLAPFQVQITAFSAGVPDEVLHSYRVTPARSLEELYRGTDVLICCEALTSATFASVDRRALGLLNHGAVFVNVGRGAVVDEEALAQAAKDRGLRVALDVTVEEPPSPESSLWTIPNLILSPHIAGPTIDSYQKCGSLALENVRDFFSGQPLSNRVDPISYARST